MLHITTEAMNILAFQSYRKIAFVQARPLTEADYRQRGGMIHTREAIAAFKPGDYLARGNEGDEWPISQEGFAVLCDERVTEPDAEGFASYRSTRLYQAVQIAEPFTVERARGGLFTGQADDYLVRLAGAEGGWIVEPSLFELRYERLLEE